MKSSICNVIIMQLVPLFVKNTPSRFERFYLLIVRESRPSLDAGGLLPPTFDNATFRANVLSMGMQIRATRGIAGSNGISYLFLSFVR